jgi:hypothetical protein
VGYGVAFGGLAALPGMPSSCSSEVSMVNIDNGFGAEYQANLINLTGKPKKLRLFHNSVSAGRGSHKTASIL